MDYVEFFCGNLHDSYKFRSIIHKVVSKDGYCSHGCVPRGVFVRILHENPEFYGAKRRFLPFLCIAKRVIVRSTPLFGGV